MNISPYIKAVVAALVAGLTSLGTALTDGAVDASEIVSVVLAFLLGLGIVYAAPANSDDELGEDGAVSVATIALVVIAAVLLLTWFGVDGHLG